MGKAIKVKFRMTRRRVYHFKCLHCGEDRITVHKENLRIGWCKLCRGSMPVPGQLKIV